MTDAERLIKARSCFPHIQEGKVYLNHAATGPFSSPVKQALNKYLKDRATDNIENYLDLMGVIEETLQWIGEMINAPAQNLEFAPNTSYGLNVLAQGLSWNPGDRIIIPACEFPANVYPFLQLRSQGVEIDFVPHTEGTFGVGDIEALMTDRTRLLTLSWVQFLSGFRVDLESIADLCKKRNVLLSVDAIQGLGALEIDVQQAGIDFLASGGHKWLLAAQGIGFVYVSDSLLQKLDPMLGWLNGPVDWRNLTDYDMAPYPDARKFRLGTLNGLGITALHASLKLYREMDPTWCERNLLKISKYARQRLESLGLTVYGSSDESHLAGISSFVHPESDALFSELNKNRIYTALRDDKLRFSPGYYAAFEDIDRAASVISSYLGG